MTIMDSLVERIKILEREKGFRHWTFELPYNSFKKYLDSQTSNPSKIEPYVTLENGVQLEIVAIDPEWIHLKYSKSREETKNIVEILKYKNGARNQA